MLFEISILCRFAAAHALRLPGGGIEPLHGHNWRLRVCVGAERLDAMGTVMDFHELERLIEPIVEPMQNRNLNELEWFAAVNPSAENVARHVAQSLDQNVKLPASVRLLSVEVWETDDCQATYRPGSRA
jgi:6-pyruvoyltetrahydropterin/6-carboxytetrahydropterin synthase